MQAVYHVLELFLQQWLKSRTFFLSDLSFQ